MSEKPKNKGEKPKKALISKAFDMLFWVLVVVLFARQAPLWWKTYQRQGKPMKSAQVFGLSGEDKVVPTGGEKNVLVFWTTWCGPCRKQISMMNTASEEGKFPSEKIKLINMGEPQSEVRAYLKKYPTKFEVLLAKDKSAWSVFEVDATPTVLFIDSKGMVDYATSGLSPMLNNRVRAFLVE